MSDSPGLDSDGFRAFVFDTLGPPGTSSWYVAYSGGLDSTVLLHRLWRMCAGTGTGLVALHADHGLQACSGQWCRQCAARCRDWEIEFRSARLVLNETGPGPEGVARRARYDWFRDQVGTGGWLLTGHHRGDQAETVIERLARGAGPRGLRGVRLVTSLYGMRVARPLLDIPRRDILAYARKHGLDWVEDESNRSTRYTRNYIRHRVLPVLAARWPDIENSLARSASVMADAEFILEEQALADLRRVRERPMHGDRTIAVSALQALPAARRRNLLRFWIHRETGVLPGYTRLTRIIRALQEYPLDRGGLYWPPVELRVFRDYLYLLRAGAPPVSCLNWDARSELHAGAGMILRPRGATGHGLKRTALRDGVQVVFRRGGEKCRLPGRRHRHALKEVLRQAGIPPWQRPRIPMIRIGDDIAAVVGVTACEPYLAGPGEPGIEIDLLEA